MAFLLDTHTLVWWLYSPELISGQVIEIISDSEQTIFVSAITAFEIANKYRVGKWDEVRELATDFDHLVAEQGFTLLSINSGDAARAALIESAHRDPFDRILAAQSARGQLILLTKDGQLQGLGAITFW